MKDDTKNQSSQIPDRTPPRVNGISCDGIECIDDVDSVITRWIESPRVISVHEEQHGEPISVEDLLVLAAVVKPDDDALEYWKSDLDLVCYEREREMCLHELVKQASGWLGSDQIVNDEDWARIVFEFGEMASGEVTVEVNEFTRGIYVVSIKYGWEGKQFPCILGTVSTDDFVENLIELIGFDPAIGFWWDGPSSALRVSVGGRLPVDQRIAIEENIMNRHIVIETGPVSMTDGMLHLHIFELVNVVKIELVDDEGRHELDLDPIAGSYNWRSVVESLTSLFDHCEEGIPVERIQGARGLFEEGMFRLAHGGQWEGALALQMSKFSDQFLWRLIKEEGSLHTAAQKIIQIAGSDESLCLFELTREVLPICPESLLVDLADQEGSILKGWITLLRFCKGLPQTDKKLKDVVKLYESGDHPGMAFAHSQIPDWIEEKKERIAREEELLKPWKDQIEEMCTAVGYDNKRIKGGNNLHSAFANGKKFHNRSKVQSFIEEHILEHGSLPTGTHEILLAGYMSSNPEPTSVTFP